MGEEVLEAIIFLRVLYHKIADEDVGILFIRVVVRALQDALAHL